MVKNINLNGQILFYELTYKQVKNINLRIKKDGTVHVSANQFVPISVVEEFIVSKKDFILKAINKFKHENSIEQTQYFNEEEIKQVILKICADVYPYFAKRGVGYPEIRFRKMVSCWGNCKVQKGILTFNTNLMYAPLDCVRYVVLHEFTHFLQSNHSKLFYNELEKVCPEWKKLRESLKKIIIY